MTRARDTLSFLLDFRVWKPPARRTGIASPGAKLCFLGISTSAWSTPGFTPRLPPLGQPWIVDSPGHGQNLPLLTTLRQNLAIQQGSICAKHLGNLGNSVVIVPPTSSCIYSTLAPNLLKKGRKQRKNLGLRSSRPEN